VTISFSPYYRKIYKGVTLAHGAGSFILVRNSSTSSAALTPSPQNSPIHYSLLLITTKKRPPEGERSFVLKPVWNHMGFAQASLGKAIIIIEV